MPPKKRPYARPSAAQAPLPAPTTFQPFRPLKGLRDAFPLHTPLPLPALTEPLMPPEPLSLTWEDFQKGCRPLPASDFSLLKPRHAHEPSTEAAPQPERTWEWRLCNGEKLLHDSGRPRFHTPEQDPVWSLSLPDLPHRLHRLLGQPHTLASGVLDLHGLTQDQARHAFEQFLLESIVRGKGIVRVIFGKGKNSKGSALKLKHTVQQALSHNWSSALVRAACTAHPCHGGVGAADILLRDHGMDIRKKEALRLI